jgi:hypothetical protein
LWSQSSVGSVNEELSHDMAGWHGSALNLQILAQADGVSGSILQREIRGQHFGKNFNNCHPSIQFTQVGRPVAVLCQIKDKLIHVPPIGF